MSNGKRELTEKDKEVLAVFDRMCERLGKSMEAYYSQKPKAIDISKLPKESKLPEEEKLLMPKKFAIYMQIQKDAIDVLNKHIERLKRENPETNKALIADLENGLRVLTVGMEREIKEGVEGLIARLESYKPGKRPGLGLTRGFDEILLQREDWEGEIMEAVRKIEHYFASM